jgi:uncharacterized delta-60 repeat protein
MTIPFRRLTTRNNEVEIMKIQITNKITTFVFAILALILFGATIGTAAPGDLDTTFGSGGIVITGGFNLDVASTMAIQSDGKIVVVGDGSNGTFNWDFAVVRYNTNGSLDTSFGGSGIVITQLTGDYDAATAVAIQADGKIVVAGSRYNETSGSSSSIAVVRYNSNGSLDTSFNGTGIVITSVGSSRDYAEAVAIQTDGKIVVAGTSLNASNNLDFAIVRYNSNGSLDTSFGGTGKVITPVGNFNDWTSSVAIQADGKIVASGYSGLNVSEHFVVVRYNPNGSLDTTFNGTGKVTTSVGNSNSGASDLAIQTDGKIVVAGISRNVSNDFAVVRYNPNGSLDTSFGGTGKITIPFGDSHSDAKSVAIQSDGKIVAVGQSGNGNTGFDFAVIRLNPNGSLDMTFGGTGKVITPIVNQDFISFASAVAIQPDGKIVAAGSYGIEDEFSRFAVARYIGDSVLSNRKFFDFDGDGRSDVSVFRLLDGTWYLNRSTQGFAAAQFGLPSDKITPADYDGDGKTDIAVFRDGTWYLLRSTQSFAAIQFGAAGDIPVPADYTGDGRAELAVYRGGNWYSFNLANNQFNSVQFGIASDKPVVADYDGDNRADYAVYRNGIWYLSQSTQGFAAIQFGLPTDQPVPADYDGDNKADITVFRGGIWYIQRSASGFTGVSFGAGTDVPVAADYDGDSKADMAVFRPSTAIWYLQRSQAGFTGVAFGAIGDVAVPSAYIP